VNIVEEKLGFKKYNCKVSAFNSLRYTRKWGKKRILHIKVTSCFVQLDVADANIRQYRLHCRIGGTQRLKFEFSCNIYGYFKGNFAAPNTCVFIDHLLTSHDFVGFETTSTIFTLI